MTAKKKRASPQRKNGKSTEDFRSAQTTKTPAGIWGLLVLLVAAAACYLTWSSLKSRSHNSDEMPLISKERASIFAGIKNSDPALRSDATATEVKLAAIGAADALTAEFPDNVTALAISAALRSKLGDTECAAGMWQVCLEIDPNFADAYRHLGQLARDRGDFQEASKMLDRAVALGQTSPEVLAMLGDSLLQSGSAQEAITVLTQDTSETTISEKGLLTLAQAYLQVADYEKAEATLQRLTRATPENARAYYLLANVYARLGEREKSQECSLKFQALAKVDYEARAQELRSYVDAATLRNLLAQTHYRCGHVYAAEGELAKAEQAWLKTAMLLPHHIQCRNELLYLYERQEKIEDALEISEQLCDADPETADNWYNLGLLNTKLGRSGPAAAALQKAQQLAPENPRYRQAYDLVREGMR